MILENTSVPVVVLDSGHTGGLGITRSLGKLGVRVLCIDNDPLAPAFFSKYCESKHICNFEMPQEAVATYLLNIASKIGKRSVLIPTSDKMVNMVMDYRDLLKEFYIFPSISPELVKSLTSKKEMFYVANNCGVPTPRAYFPLSRDDLENYLDQTCFPVMLKGIDGELLAQRSGKRMFIVKTKSQLLNIYDQYNDASNSMFMIQEYIPGRDDTVWMFNGYFNDNSECLFGITGRKLRQSPVYTGVTSLGVCERNDRLYELVLNFMKKIRYKGILDIGFKFDRRDNEYKVLDVNPRIGASFRLFLGKNGLDVARVAYLDLTGQDVVTTQMIEGRKWVVENWDLVSSARYLYDRKITFFDWIRSYRGVKETAWFSLDDTLPFFIMITRFVRKAISQLHYR